MKNLILILLIFLDINCYCIKPEKNYSSLPDSLGIPFQHDTIITPDNYKLNCWIIPPIKDNDKKTTIIISYPDAGNMADYLYQAAMLSQIGFTAVLFDYRGFGRSSDFKITREMLYYDEFVTDLATVIKWTKTNLKNTKTGVWGLSMGTIITTLATKTEPLDFFIAEGYVCSPDTLKNRYKRKFNEDIILPKSSETYTNVLHDINLKMLVFVGLKDEFTTDEDAKRIVGQNIKRQIVEFDGKHLHGLWVLTDKSTGDLYFKKIIDFLAD